MNFYRAFATCLLTLIVLSTQLVSAKPISPSRNTSSGAVALPCSIIIKPVDKTLAPNTYGVALISKYRRKYSETSPMYQERTSINVLVNRLPPPSTYGDFDGYAGFAQIPNKISWTFKLLPRQEFQMDATWAGRFDEISTVLTPSTLVQVRPYNSKTQKLGAAILESTLAGCRGASTALSTSAPANAIGEREGIFEDALLHQYSNHILDRIQSRNYCARVLDIKETFSQTDSTSSFTTTVGVVSKNNKGRWEYLRMTIVDDIMGVRVTDSERKTDLSQQQAYNLCGGNPKQEHYPLKAHFPPRYMNEFVRQAESVPITFIHLVNQKRYDDALSLLSPHLRQYYSRPGGQEVLRNSKYITLVKLKDITDIKPVHYYLQRHYAIKAYGAILNKEVYNPQLLASCPGAIGLQVNNFVVIKFTPESPWLLDAQIGVPPTTAKLWGLDVGRDDWSFCGQESRQIS